MVDLKIHNIKQKKVRFKLSVKDCVQKLLVVIFLETL